MTARQTRAWKVATFNVNSVRQRMETILEWLALHDPDVLCLQETKVANEQFPTEDLSDAGYHVAYSGMKAYNGVAIISRQPPDEVRIGLDEQDAEQDRARAMRARFGEVTIFNTYVPQGFQTDSPKYAYKLAWFERVRATLAREHRPEDKLLWLGDLNVAPTLADVYDPKRLQGHVCFNPEIIAAFERVCAWGLVDVFRKHQPGPDQFTFWDYRMRGSLDRNRGWRIDHLMATRPLAQCSTDAYVDIEPRLGDKPSDHTPVVCVFEQ